MKEKIAALSIFTNLILAIGKIIIGVIVKSSAILAEGVHSGMDVISSIISFAGIKIAKKPVDKKHPYGHYKFEVLSGLVITILLFIAGAGMIYEAYKGFINPKIIAINYLSIGIMILSILLNETMARLKIYYGKKENSLSLLSDGVHDRVDVYTSIAVLVGLFIVPYWRYIDSVLALVIGVYILKESFSLGKEATDSLLDVSAGQEIENQIKEIINKNNIKVSEIKTQKRGSVITANLVINLPKDINVQEATEISESLKKELIEKIKPLEYVAIQIKSQDITSSYFKPRDFVSRITSRRGFGWQRRGRFKETIKDAQGKGPGGYCVCKKCGYKTEHKKGIPCSTIKCPECNEKLVRE